MIQLLTRFAAESGPVVNVAPAGGIEVFGFPITNSVLYGWISMLIIIVSMILVARKVSIKPKAGIIQYVELGVEFIANLVENAFDDKKKARKYVPFFVTIFFVILLNNWLGLLPFVGEGFQMDGHPLLRPFTGDLNGTLGLGLVTMLMVYGASIREAGGLGRYLRHFFIGSPFNPFYFFVGLLEMLTDLTRALSLALRLFLNIAIGEIVIAVFAYLGHIFAPITALPFTLLEFLVAVLQAYIFTVLSIMYLAVSVNNTASHAHAEDDDTHEVPAERVKPIAEATS